MTTNETEIEPEGSVLNAAAAISEFAETLGTAAFKQYVYTMRGKDWECNGIYDDKIHLLEDLAVEHGPGKHKILIRHKTGELDKTGKPIWSTFTRILTIGPHFRKEHEEYLRLNGLAQDTSNVPRAAGLFEMLDIGKLKDLATFFVGLKSIMGGGNAAGEMKEVFAQQAQMQTQIMTALITSKPAGNEALLLELIKDRGRDNGASSMEKMIDILREGISIGREGGEDEGGGTLEKMATALAPSIVGNLMGIPTAPQAPQIAEVEEVRPAPIAPPRRPAKAPQAPRNEDIGAIVSKLQANPQLAAVAYDRIKEAHGKETADLLAKQYNIPIPGAPKKRTLKVV